MHFFDKKFISNYVEEEIWQSMTKEWFLWG